MLYVVKSEGKGVTGSEVKDVKEDGDAVAVGDDKQHLEVVGEVSEDLHGSSELAKNLLRFARFDRMKHSCPMVFSFLGMNA
mmetsp:Transcript_105775/g.303980  ORF Transcript_105775/g.303980 Transcript_105775/m.303980 type:complete len:81 (-) Transcript_105775:560-802(-)